MSDASKTVEYLDLSRFPCLGTPEAVAAVNQLFERRRENMMHEIATATGCKLEEVAGMFYLLYSRDAAIAFILVYHKQHNDLPVYSHRIPMEKGIPDMPLRCNVCDEEIETLDDLTFDLQFQLVKDIEFVSEAVHG
jgi:hypothetical protein